MFEIVKNIFIVLIMALSSFAYAADNYTDTHLLCLYKDGSVSDKLEVVLKIANCDKPTCKVAMVFEDLSHMNPKNFGLNVEVSHDYYRWKNSLGTKFVLNRVSGELIFGKEDAALGPYICSAQQQKF
jgi:hypothetical protein